MITHFMADPHFEHENVLAMSGRPFVSIEEHNEILLHEINCSVGTKDRLFILGDVCWRGEESWMSRIRCKNVHLIYGNHDKPKLGKFFKTAEDVAEVKIAGHKVWLSHYPHAYWPASHHGSFHLYGHIHAAREHYLDAMFPGRRSMDVGVDNAKRLLGSYRPFSEDEVISILDDRPGHDHVDWYERQRKQQQTWKEIYFPATVTALDKHWHEREQLPDLPTMIAESHGYPPLKNGEQMTVHYRGRGYIIKRDDSAA